jgi:hypothetical protein
MPAANTRDCFTKFIGQRVVGVLFDALPTNRRDIAAGTKTLIFEDGHGLTIASNGSYWVAIPGDVRRAVDAKSRELTATQEEMRGVLALAGGPDTEEQT